MSSTPNRTPNYLEHKPSGLAYVRLNGRCFYLGRHGTRESRAAYDRLIAEWLSNGRCVFGSGAGDLSINELAARFWKQRVESYYLKNGKPTSEQDRYRQVLRRLRQLCGDVPASTFGPLQLKAVRQL